MASAMASIIVKKQNGVVLVICLIMISLMSTTVVLLYESLWVEIQAMRAHQAFHEYIIDFVRFESDPEQAEAIAWIPKSLNWFETRGDDVLFQSADHLPTLVPRTRDKPLALRFVDTFSYQMNYEHTFHQSKLIATTSEHGQAIVLKLPKLYEQTLYWVRCPANNVITHAFAVTVTGELIRIELKKWPQVSWNRYPLGNLDSNTQFEVTTQKNAVGECVKWGAQRPIHIR